MTDTLQVTLNNTLLSKVSPAPDPWAAVPAGMRPLLRVCCNSNLPQDRERAIGLCEVYGLDYAVVRALVRNEARARLRAEIARLSEGQSNV